MANDADAEIVISVDDQATAALTKIAAATRMLGQQWGTESKQIEKSTRAVTKAFADMSDAGGKGKASPLAANIAATRKEMERLESLAKRADGIKKTSTSFSGYTENGKGIKAKEAQEVLGAADAYKKLDTQLKGLIATEARMAQSAKANAFAKQQGAAFTIDPATLNEAARSASVLKGVYANMWQGVDNSTKKLWPPDILKGPRSLANAVGEMSNSVRYAMYDVSRTAAIAGAAFLAASVGAIAAAANWERAFADVQRTVQGTPDTLERIRVGLVSMSQTLPVSFSQLSEIASVGGQMGIGANGIVAYTETIAKLTATTNLTADAASKALGRFKSLFPVIEGGDASLAVTDQSFGNLASAILKVGVNSVATESGIVNVATQISSMAKYAGMTADQTIGLAGALSSIAVPPELSRGVITRLFNTISEAVSEGGVRLSDFAGIAGVSASEFSSAWGTDKFGHIFTDLIAGLNGITEGGGDAVGTLHELGITSVRDVPVLLRLAGAAGEAGAAGSLLAQTMNDSRSGWRDNIELSIQYNKIAQTLSERVKVLFQNFEALFATLGSGSVGPAKDVVNFLITAVRGLTAMAASPVGQFFATLSVVIGAAAGALFLLAAGAARGVASMQGLHAGLLAVTGSASAATAGVRAVSIAMVGLGALGAILAVVGVIAAIATGAQQASNAVTDTSGALAAMRADAESGSGVIMKQGFDDAKASAEDLSSQADNLGKVLGRTSDQLYGSASAADASGSAMENAALRYGTASKQYLRAAITGNQAFQDLFKGERGANLADELVAGSFDIEKAMKLGVTKDRAAVMSYLGEVFDIDVDKNGFVVFDENADTSTTKRAASMKALGDIFAESGAVMRATGQAAYATGEAVSGLGSTYQLAAEDAEEFKVANQEVIESMAKGFANFVDSGSLIKFTQQYKDAMAVIDDPETDTDERIAAIGDYEKAWRDAYGGAAFSLGEYMVQFEKAAGEQDTFTRNIQQLFTRRLDPAIIGDLAAMGPAASQLVQALVNSTDAELQNYEALYQKTGFDSMVALAAGQLAAEGIVREAGKNLTSQQLQQLSADLAAGTPLADAMAKWQLDANGRPMKVPYVVEGETVYTFRQQAQDYFNNRPIKLPLTAYITNPTISDISGGQIIRMKQPYAEGGFTGRGTKWQPAGTVHAGEYVFPQRDVDQRTGTPKADAMLRMMRGGRQAPRGGGPGYANGGFVTGQGGITHLSIEDRSLLMQIRDAVGVYISERSLTNATNAGNLAASQRMAS